MIAEIDAPGRHGCRRGSGRGLARSATATNPGLVRVQQAFAATWTAEAAFTVAIAVSPRKLLRAVVARLLGRKP
jgi:hypothetical protein